MKKNHILAIAVTAAMAIPSAVFATNGMIPMGFGAKAKGMGGASIALPQEATAAANNPAGMVFLGKRVDFGAEVFIADRTGEIAGNNYPFAPPGAMDFKATANNNSFAVIPEGGFNTMINNRMSLGVSVVGVGGMNTNYDSLALFNGMAGPQETGIDLMQLKIIPTIAYKFNDRNSIGIGLELGYQLFKAYGLQGFTGTNSMPIPGYPAGSFYDQQASSSPGNVTNSGYDSAFGIGFSLGWQGQVTDTLTLAATYHSKNNMQEFDNYKGLFANQGDLDMPAWFGLGLSFKATPKMTVAFDFTRTYYSGVSAISNKLQVGAPPGFPSGMNMFIPGTMLGNDQGSGFGWEDVNVYKLGIAYELSSAWTLRGGWNHGDNPIKSGETFFNLLAPGTITDHLTVGATRTLSNKSELSMYGYYAFNSETRGSNSIPQAFGGGEANIDMNQLAFGLAYGWNF